ncbi:MAG: dipeptide epimerase, partial [Methylocystis sp.]
MKRKLSVAIQSYPIAGSFVISRGAKTEAVVVTATLVQGGGVGRGECVP